MSVCGGRFKDSFFLQPKTSFTCTPPNPTHNPIGCGPSPTPFFFQVVTIQNGEYQVGQRGRTTKQNPDINLERLVARSLSAYPYKILFVDAQDSLCVVGSRSAITLEMMMTEALRYTLEPSNIRFSSLAARPFCAPRVNDEKRNKDFSR